MNDPRDRDGDEIARALADVHRAYPAPPFRDVVDSPRPAPAGTPWVRLAAAVAIAAAAVVFFARGTERRTATERTAEGELELPAALAGMDRWEGPLDGLLASLPSDELLARAPSLPVELPLPDLDSPGGDPK